MIKIPWVIQKMTDDMACLTLRRIGDYTYAELEGYLPDGSWGRIDKQFAKTAEEAIYLINQNIVPKGNYKHYVLSRDRVAREIEIYLKKKECIITAKAVHSRFSSTVAINVNAEYVSGISVPEAVKKKIRQGEKKVGWKTPHNYLMESEPNFLGKDKEPSTVVKKLPDGKEAIDGQHDVQKAFEYRAEKEARHEDIWTAFEILFAKSNEKAII